MPPAISPEQRARILELARAETPVRVIAKEVGCSVGTVSNVCATEGVQLDRDVTKAATEAKMADSAARRATQEDESLASLEKIQERLWPTDPDAEPATMRDIASGAKAYRDFLEAHLRLAAYRSRGADGVDKARSVLGEIRDALRGHLPDEPE